MTSEKSIEILFAGTKKIGKVPFLLFKIKIGDEIKSECSIPSDDLVCNHIMSHLGCYFLGNPKEVEVGNDEDSI